MTETKKTIGTDLENECWDIINSYFEENPNWLARHQIDSYNDFVSNKIPLIMKNINHMSAFMFDKLNKDISYKVDIFLGGKEANKFRIAPPSIYDHKTQQMRPLFPNEARLKNLTYGFDIFVDMELDYSSKRGDEILFEGLKLPETGFLSNIYLGKIPIMLQSNMCSLNKIPKAALPEFGESEYEPGGYFIIDGREKVFLCQERKVENVIILSTITDVQQQNKYKHSAEIKSVNDEGFTNPRNNKLLFEKAGTITFLVGMEDKPFIDPFEGRHIPIFILFRLLGVESDMDIIKMIVGDITSELGIKLAELLRESAHDPFITRFHIYDKQNAEKYLEPLASRSKTNISAGSDQLAELQKNKLNRLSFLYDTIYENILPHCGPEFINKSYYLAYMVRKLLLKELGIEQDTDRDSFLNKRVDTSGYLLATLFRETARSGFMYNARRQIETIYEMSGNDFLGKNVINIVNENNFFSVFDSSIFMNGIPDKSIPGFMNSLKRGTIGMKVGVIQALDRINNYAVISHIRRLNDPVLGGRVQDKQRYLHNTHYGYLCPAETPEGQSVGLRKALALLTTITIGYPGNQLRELCIQLGTIPLKYVKPADIYAMTKVFINGAWFGNVINPLALVDRFRLMRRNGLINQTTSIAWYTEKGEIYICSDNGRLTRPLLIIGPGNELLIQPADIKGILTGKSKFSDLCRSKLPGKDGFLRQFTDINVYKSDVLNISSRDPELYEKLRISQGPIEYIDVLEMDTLLLARDIKYEQNSKNKYTHVDLHPSIILGAMVQTSPFIHHGQSGKYFGHSKHIKQSVSAYTDNYWHRIDTSAHLLHNPERPLIQTRMTGVMNHDKLGTGQNIIVAVAYYNGYNQEDGILANKTSIDMGLFDSSYYKMYEEVEKQDEKAGMEERFYNPKYVNEFEDYPADLQVKPDNKLYDNLDKFGFIKEGTYIDEEDTILIGKYLKLKDQNNQVQHMDMSKHVKTDNIESYVDKVFTCTTNAAGNRLCKIRTCQHRIPQHGDKFASRNGQKGTVGLFIPREDMPFTEDGIVPDMVLHPSAYPKRMTLNQLLEMLYGTLAAECGFYGVANGLDSFDAELLNEILCDKLGFTYYGDRVLYNGIYGEQMDVAIFTGPLFVQRLKLQVQDKINARQTGARKDGVPIPGGAYTVRERAVVSGRANHGGIKLGEMERDALIAHGVSGFINEMCVVRGDKFYVYVSTKNGEIVVGNPDDNIFLDTFEDGPLSYHLSEGTGQRSLLGLNTMNKRQHGFIRLTIPYAMKLMIQELNGLGMRLRLQPKIVKMLIDRDLSVDITGTNINDLILELEENINADETMIGELLEKSLSEQIEKQLDAEAKIEDSYNNANIETPFAQYKATELAKLDANNTNITSLPVDASIFKHPDELSPVNITPVPIAPGLTTVPPILTTAAPTILPADSNMVGGGAAATNGTSISSLLMHSGNPPAAATNIPISSGLDDDFALLPLNHNSRRGSASGASELITPTGSAMPGMITSPITTGLTNNIPTIMPGATAMMPGATAMMPGAVPGAMMPGAVPGAMMPSPAEIKSPAQAGIETKVINISGSDSELREMGLTGSSD